MSDQNFQTQVLQKLDSLERRFDGVDAKFDGVDTRFEGVNARLDGLQESVAVLQEDLTEVKSDLVEVKRDVKGLYVHTEDLMHKQGVTRSEHVHLRDWVGSIAQDLELLKKAKFA